MAFLTLPGYPDVPIALDGAERLEPELVGDLMTTFSGGTRSGIRGRVRSWRFTTTQLAPADARALYFALTSRGTVQASGDAFDGETVTCRATVQAASYRPNPPEVDRAVTFTLRETTPYSPVLFTYRPGDLGYTFSRASTASYRSEAGVISTAASGALRDSHYALNPASGLYERSALLEGARTNLILYSEQFDNAVWVKHAEISVTANQLAAPDGATTADLLTRTAGTSGLSVTQTFTTNASASRYAVRIAVRGGTRTACSFGIYNVTAGAFPAQTGRVLSGSATISPGGPVGFSDLPTSAWTVVEVVLDAAPAAGDDLALYFYPGGINSVVAGTLYVWGAQAEEGAFSSSYIPTTAAAVTRSADSTSFSFTGAPQAMTAYARFVEGGGVLLNTSPRVIHIGSASNAAPRFALFKSTSTTGYTVLHENGTDSRFVGASVAPAIGNLVELRGVLAADGSVYLGQSINGGAEAVSLASSAATLATAWSGELAHLGSVGLLSPGRNAFTHAAVLKGERTLAQCRAAAGVS